MASRGQSCHGRSVPVIVFIRRRGVACPARYKQGRAGCLPSRFGFGSQDDMWATEIEPCSVKCRSVCLVWTWPNRQGMGPRRSHSKLCWCLLCWCRKSCVEVSVFRCAGFRTLVYSTCFMHSNASGGSLAWSTGQKAGQCLSLAVFDDLTRGTAGNAPLSVAASQRTCAPYRSYLPYATTYLASVRAVSLWVSLCFVCNATFVDGDPGSFCVQRGALRNPRFRD